MLSHKLIEILSNKKTYWILIFLNLIVSITVFILNRNSLGGDYATYSSLAEGLLKGKYSMYYFLQEKFPDTYRNPGYPIFLAILKIFSPSIIFVQIVQLAIYFLTIIISIKILNHYFNDNDYIKNLFLFFLLININIVMLSTYFLPEILMSFLILFSFYFELKFTKNNYFKFLFLGLLYGIIFQVRPIFLFFPILKVVIDFFLNRTNFKFIKYLTMIFIYFLSMIPFGLWNYFHHGVFKITSLKGGAEVLNSGYWAQKIPNYEEHRSFGNMFYEEPLLFINLKDKSRNIENYNKEWDYIDSASLKYLTNVDMFYKELKAEKKKADQFRKNLKEHHIYDSISPSHKSIYSSIIGNKLKEHSIFDSIPITFSSRYTIEREKIILDVTLKDIINDKEYVIKSKIYSAIRLWVTGIPLAKFRNATLKVKLLLLCPMFLTGFIFLLSIIFIPIAFIKFKILYAKLHSILIIIIYFGLIHVPFVIQSRYTIPVRMLLLIVLSVSIYYVLFKPIVKDEELIKS